MLLGLRDRIAGYLAWIFVALISIPFVLWGIQDYVGVGEASYAVKINDEKISLNEYDRVLSAGRMNLAQAYQGRIPSYFDVDGFLRKQTLEHLIQRELLDQLITERNYRIDGGILQQQILRDQYFQVDGSFNKDRYQAELSSRGLQPREYENILKRELIVEQLNRGIEQTAFIPEQELAEYAGIAHQTRSYSYVLVPFSVYEKNTKVTPAEIENYYSEHPGQLMTDELVKIAYIEFSLEEMAKDVQVSAETLRELYKSAIDAGRYQTEEVRDGAHILIRVPDNAAEAVIAEKKKKAEDILQRLRQGADFAAVAKQESEDPGSAEQGGALGDVRKGAMVKPFEDTLFALKKGELSEPVLTRFGFHIIKVNAIQPPQIQAFDEVKAEIEQNYRKEQTDAAFYDRVDRLQTLTFENPGGLEVIAEQLGLSIKESGFFARGGDSTGIAESAPVRDAAFSAAVLQEKQNSGLIEIGDNHVVVLRIKDHQPSRAKTLAEARTEIAALVKQEKTTAAVMQTAGKILADAASGGELRVIAKSYDAEYHAAVNVKRDDPAFPSEVQQSAFRMVLAAEGKPALKQTGLSNGDAAVIRLTGIKEGDIATLNASERDQLRQQMQQARGRYDFNAMLAALREDAEIVVNDSDINPDPQQ
ncbi:MAG TPA: SurA N-terminal domain-containing protein [Gammaproteobacteria bacterium]